MPVSKKQRAEWTENPVRLELLKLAQAELTRIVETSCVDCLAHGEPNKTHENIVELEARAKAWYSLIEVLGGDWDYLEGYEDE